MPRTMPRFCSEVDRNVPEGLEADTLLAVHTTSCRTQSRCCRTLQVDLDVLEGLEAQAADTRGRLDLLNAWAERRDAAEKEWKKKQGKGSCLGGRGKGKGEEALPFQFPEAPPPEVTIYDVGGEGVAMEEGAKGAGAGAAVEEGEQQAKAKD